MGGTPGLLNGSPGGDDDFEDDEDVEFEEEEDEDEDGEERPPRRTREAEGDDEPPAEHPRFKKVYGRMRAAERERDEERRKREDAEEKLRQFRAEHDKEPDSREDPEGWKKWNERKSQDDRAALEEQERKRRLDIQIETCKAVFGDKKYRRAIDVAERAMKRDPDLRRRIWASENPARAAYKWAMKKMAGEKSDKDSLEQEPTPERGGHKPKRRTVELTQTERNFARQQGMTDEEFAKNRDAMPNVSAALRRA